MIIIIINAKREATEHLNDFYEVYMPRQVMDLKRASHPRDKEINLAPGYERIVFDSPLHDGRKESSTHNIYRIKTSRRRGFRAV